MWICELCGYEIWEEEDVYMLRDQLLCVECHDQNIRTLRCYGCGIELPEDMMSIARGVYWCTPCKWAPGGPMDARDITTINKVVVI